MKIALLLLVSILFFTGCKEASTAPDCSHVLCAYNPLSIRVKYVDKGTNNGLIHPSNSKYTLADFKVTRAAMSNYTPEATVDQTDNSIIIINYINSGDVLTLGNLAPDKIMISTKNRTNECCSAFDITSLKINNETLCAPCNDLDKMVLIIKK